MDVLGIGKQIAGATPQGQMFQWINQNLTNEGDTEAGMVLQMSIFETRTDKATGKAVKVNKSRDILPMPQNVEVSYRHNWAWQEAGDYGSISGIGQEITRGIYKVGEALAPARMMVAGKSQLGFTLNEKVKYLYNGPEARNFSYNLHFQPNSSGENDAIQAWIKKVKAAAAPDHTVGTQFWKFPMFFEMQWPKIDKLFKTGTVALNNITVNYTPDGMWSEHTDGLPTATKVSLSFTELDYATRDRINKGGW